MPNTLTIVFTSAPSTEPVEFPHPNTGVYVTGTQATAGGSWQVVFTGVTKGTYSGLTGRLKNYPAVSATIAASGPVLNNVLVTPTGFAANGTSTTAINVTVNSVINLTAYRLLAADASAGPFTQLYQGTTASYPHTGLAAGQIKYYEWQYVGGGFYDDSALSAVFSGTTTAALTTLTPVLANYGLNGGILRTNTAGQNLHAGLSQLQINLNGATAGTLNVFSTGGSANVLAYDGTTLIGEQVAGANSLTGLSGGTLTLYMGGQQRSLEQGDVQGADVSSFVFAAGATGGNFITPAQTTRAVAVFGDSISNGATLAFSQRDAFSALIRSGRNSSTVLGYGSGTAGVLFDPANYATLLKPRLQAIWGGANEQAGVLLIGTNDYGGSGGGAAANGGLSAAALQTRLNAAFTSITTDFPNAKLLLITPLYRADEASLNSYSLALPAYRTAEANAAAAFPAITVRDGSSLLVPGAGDYAPDGVHPTAAGHQKIFNFAQPTLDAIFNGTATNLVDMAGLAAANYTQLVNASFSGGTLAKLAGGINQFDGGAVATFLLGTTAGTGVKGQVKFQPATTVRTGNTAGGTVFGVSTAGPNYSAVSPTNGTPTNYFSISAAFYFDGAKYGLIEAGQEKPFQTYLWPATGALPMLDIQVTESKVNYYANRVLLYTSNYNPVPAFPLYVDVALSTPTSSALAGLQIAGVNLVATPAPAAPPVAASVVWSNFRNEAVTSGLLHLVSDTAAGTNGFSGGASSTVAIGALSGTGEVGRLSLPGISPAPSSSGGFVAGLMSGPSYAGTATTGAEYYSKIKYSIYRDASLYRVFELGTKMFEAAFPAGATYKLEIVVFNAYVSYQRDGVEFYRNTTAPALPLYAEATFASAANYATTGGNLAGATITAGNSTPSGF